VIAQELREVIPEAIESFRTKLRPDDADDTELLGVNPLALVSYLILATQELTRRVIALEQTAN
jgi:hypothetical protein